MAQRTPSNNRPSPVNLTPAQKTRLRELLNGNFASQPDLAFRAVGVTEDRVRQSLNLPEGELTTDRVLSALIGRVDTIEANVAEVASSVNRLRTDVSTLARRIEALPHGSVVSTVLGSPAVTNSKTFINALQQGGMDDEEIKGVFAIIGDEGIDLTDAQAFAELTTSFHAFRAATNATLTDHGARLNAHDRILGPEGTNITSLTGRVNHVEHAHDELKQSIVVSSRISPAAWFTGLTVFLLSWFMFSRKNWLVISTGTSSGSTVTSTGELPLNSWYYQGLVSLCLGAFAMAIVWGLQRNRARSTTSSSTRTNTQVPVYAPVRVAAPADATLVYPPISPAPAAVRAQVAAQSNSA